MTNPTATVLLMCWCSSIHTCVCVCTLTLRLTHSIPVSVRVSEETKGKHWNRGLRRASGGKVKGNLKAWVAP